MNLDIRVNRYWARFMQLLNTIYKHGRRVLVWIKLLKHLHPRTAFKVILLSLSSRGQLLQDLFSLAITNFKRDGFFVEFGATDGKSISNTFLLEKRFGWSGVLAEPARIWHEMLIRNRRAVVVTKCVWSVSNEMVQFQELKRAEYSGVTETKKSNRFLNAVSDTYLAETISINDLLQYSLENNKAPGYTDFISIDTEGSEYEIIKSLDFVNFEFGIIVCEHNYGLERHLIQQRILSYGYLLVRPDLSLWDDWFINPKLMGNHPSSLQKYLLKH